MKKNKEKKKRKPLPKFIKFMMLLTNLITIVFLVMTTILNVLPLKFYLPIVVVVILLDLFATFSIKKKNKQKRIIGLVISLLLIIIQGFCIFYEIKTNDFLNIITGTNTATENYVVIVKSSSNYSDIKDIKNKNLGVIEVDEDGYKKAIEELGKTISTNNQTFEDSYSMTDALISDDIDAYLIEESQEKILEENYDNYLNETKILYTFNVLVEQEDVTKTTDITKNSFNIYISGIDTYGNINSVSRSDVNIIMSINPNTHKISLVDIPRDYYVQLYKKSGLKDKLTHAGIYGIDTSVKTIENLLDIDINYYVKFNFTSVIKIVDKLGGVRVYSDYTFDSELYDSTTTEIYHYVKGWNTLSGKEALSFARERHAFTDGDRVRGANQEALIEAILQKVTSPKIITNYTSLLDALSSTFVTNLDEDNLKSFIKMQIDKNISWEIEKYVLDGTNGSEYTYSYPKQKLYVMIPDEESLNEAKEIINNTLNN